MRARAPAWRQERRPGREGGRALVRARPADEPVLQWLLAKDEPSVRYLVSRDLVRPKPSAASLARLRSGVTKAGVAARILAKQKNGWWGRKDTGYYPKYRGAIWRLQELGDLGVTRADEGVDDAVERFFDLHVAKDGGYHPYPHFSNGHHCLTGNMARSLIRMGYARDERVQGALDWIVRTQAPDGGWHCFTTRYGTLDSWQGLSALAEVEPRRRSRAMRASIERGAEFYLERRLLHEGKTYSPWKWLRWPMHYHYGVLVGLDVLTKLGHGKDPRMDEAFGVLLSKRQEDGRWLMDKPLRDHIAEPRDEPSRMITFLALRALRRAGRAGRL